MVAGFSTLVLQRFADFLVVLPLDPALPLDPDDVKSTTFVGADLFLAFALDLVVTLVVVFLPLLGEEEEEARVEVATVAERKLGLTPGVDNELLTGRLLKLVVSKLEIADEVVVLLREGYTLGRETIYVLPGSEEGEQVLGVGPLCDELPNEYAKVPVDPNIKEAEAVGPAKYDCNGLSNGVLLIFLLVLKPCLV